MGELKRCIMPEKIEGIDLQVSIHCRWRNVAPDPKHFTASDVRDLVDLTRYHLPDNRELDNIPMSEKSHKGLRRSEEHTSELQSLMRISYAVFCLKKKINKQKKQRDQYQTRSK